MARAESGQLPFKPGPVDLAALAQRVIGEASLGAKSRAFPLAVCGDAHLLGDPALLEHAVLSLLVQAAAVTPDETPVPVEIEAGPDRVRLAVEVADGSAIAEHLEQLIEPFAVVQFEGSCDVRSTGLGLHLVHEIARLHGATFRIKPRAGGGLVFALDLRR
ncbi:MAG: ATP-binding protein [Minicystis sp.]